MPVLTVRTTDDIDHTITDVDLENLPIGGSGFLVFQGKDSTLIVHSRNVRWASTGPVASRAPSGGGRFQ